jgi:hypothetical protein
VQDVAGGCIVGWLLVVGCVSSSSQRQSRKTSPPRAKI